MGWATQSLEEYEGSIVKRSRKPPLVDVIALGLDTAREGSIKVQVLHLYWRGLNISKHD